MSDTERREDCRERHTQLSIIWSWFQGNGNPGSKDRLIELEDMSIGREECSAMTKIKEHMDWHKESKKAMWAIYIPVYLMLITMFLQITGVI